MKVQVPPCAVPCCGKKCHSVLNEYLVMIVNRGWEKNGQRERERESERGRERERESEREREKERQREREREREKGTINDRYK